MKCSIKLPALRAKHALLGTIVALCQGHASAAEYVGQRKIVSLGCHGGDGTYFVDLDGAPFGSTLGCSVSSTNQFRFDYADTVNGRRAYASLLAAFMNSRPVTIVLLGCTSQGSPNLLYYNVL